MTDAPFYPVYAVNPFTGEAFDTDVVTSEPGGATNDMTDPNNRVLLAHMKEAGTLTKTRGPVEDEFLIPPGELLMAAVERVLRAQDCAVILEQQLAEAERLLRAVAADPLTVDVMGEISDYVAGIGAL